MKKLLFLALATISFTTLPNAIGNLIRDVFKNERIYSLDDTLTLRDLEKLEQDAKLAVDKAPDRFLYFLAALLGAGATASFGHTWMHFDNKGYDYIGRALLAYAGTIATGIITTAFTTMTYLPNSQAEIAQWNLGIIREKIRALKEMLEAKKEQGQQTIAA